MNIYSPKPQLIGYTYSREEALECKDNNGILSIRLETSLVCNLKCKYCCNKSGKALNDEISFEKLLNLIDEAKDLGAKSIVVIGGGEPTIYPKFKNLIKYIDNKNLIPVIFTNTTRITEELAEFLFKSNVSVITKIDSLNEQIQDELVGVKGAFKQIQRGLQNLINVGFANMSDRNNLRLGASFVVNKKNINDVIKIWEYCREKNIYPNLEMMIPNGIAKELNDLYLSPEEWKELKLKLLKIDQDKFGYNWSPYVTACNGCLQIFYNMYITVKGNVRSCSSIHWERAGVNLNVNTMTLKEILDSKYFYKIRHIDEYITGKCGSCKYTKECFGCRALAFADGIDKGKDLYSALASEDPSCGFYEKLF